MAWPLSPLTSYTANSTPTIKAADLNSIQQAINNAFLGTYSYKGIVVDGVGGAAAAPTAGTLTTSGALTVQSGGAQVTGNSLVTGTLTSSGALSVQSGGATVTGSVIATTFLQAGAGNITASAGDHVGRHFVGNSSTPGAAVGAAAGTGATAVVAGNDACGKLTLTTGTGTTLGGTYATITFASAYSVAPKAVVFVPADATAWNVLATTGKMVYADPTQISTTQFVIGGNSVALTASTTYTFYYIVIG